jgi:hypothetical protein
MSEETFEVPTVEVSWWLMLKLKLFGKKIVVQDTCEEMNIWIELTMYQYKDTLYVVDLDTGPIT